ncbi:DUF4349 domain-containing protein [Turicibacter bilis]|uniref:DUF4349 domain-containing protein n=1 Tax=Turicibacter bilis TaxID=2735723 RepID=A0A9Q9FHD5_9FIRM|nr:DUF4349 domain-containing protein [Turicibacter bilis]MBS3197777.1 DUF4349 domain-containing protein [Turicibacter bilis]MBS3201513.1 DUF4349 domain-containing protein [Turicibacter bilis]UUF05298.1 DUF4349 domain-containing protein [Turicibacter bilis]UUF09250.1 DUF4349 domain-containing protein [Turicibacter bilis]
MGVWNFLKRVFWLMITAIMVLILVSLIPLSFKERIESDESDEVIPSLSSSLINDESSQTYFNISIKMNVSQISESLSQLNVLVQQGSGTVMSSSLVAIDQMLESYMGSCILEIESTEVEEFLQQVELIGQITQMETYTNSEVLVTEDIDSWLSNLSMQQSKYQTLLLEAETVSDIIKLEEELARVQVEMDKWSALKAQDEVARNKVTIVFELKEGEIYDDSRWGVMIQNELSVQLNRIIQVTRWLVVKLLGLVPYGVILFVLILIMRCLFKGRKRKP